MSQADNYGTPKSLNAIDSFEMFIWLQKPYADVAAAKDFTSLSSFEQWERLHAYVGARPLRRPTHWHHIDCFIPRRSHRLRPGNRIRSQRMGSPARRNDESFPKHKHIRSEFLLHLGSRCNKGEELCAIDSPKRSSWAPRS